MPCLQELCGSEAAMFGLLRIWRTFLATIEPLNLRLVVLLRLGLLTLEIAWPVIAPGIVRPCGLLTAGVCHGLLAQLWEEGEGLPIKMAADDRV